MVTEERAAHVQELRELRPGRVSVMMPAFNAERYIGRAIGSLISQTIADWELIVVDDGSTDSTSAMVRGLGDPRITLIRQDNRGEAASRNVALEAATGEYLAFLDADDVFLPHHLECTSGYLRDHPEHAGVYADGYYVTEDERPLKSLSSRRPGPLSGRLFDALVRSSNVFGPPVCVVLRLAVVRTCNLRFDETITIGPDWDFFTHFADVGTFGYVGEHTCLYRVHRTNITQRTGTTRRQRDLASCRSNAIRMPAFARCPANVRAAAFYDLLLNALADAPDRQREVVEWPQFADLPKTEQARLLRLMASRTLVAAGDRAVARRWCAQSSALHPADPRAKLLTLLDEASPWLCRTMLRLRTARQRRRAERFRPFADLGL
jgi:hypothetical protein